MNEENLIPLSERTKSEQREIQTKGGKASGEARRKISSLKRAAKVFFQENPDAAMNIIIGLYEAACEGNVKAADKLEDLTGETVQREELALRKKQQAKAEKPDNGRMAELIAGLQEALPEDDLYEETAEADEAMGEKKAAEAESS